MEGEGQSNENNAPPRNDGEEFQEEEIFAIIRRTARQRQVEQQKFQNSSSAADAACRIVPNNAPKVIPGVESSTDSLEPGDGGSSGGMAPPPAPSPPPPPPPPPPARPLSLPINIPNRPMMNTMHPYDALCPHCRPPIGPVPPPPVVQPVEDPGEEMIPPHEIIARRTARLRINTVVAYSMCEGIGRTLKGRDLFNVRNFILKRTGFLE